ncbi:hypothetical protein METH109765_06400 [Mesobacillus thioparans]
MEYLLITQLINMKWFEIKMILLVKDNILLRVD